MRKLPGISSVFCSLYLMPKEYAEDDSWTLLSAFSTSYDPGAIIESKIMKFCYF